MHPNFSAVKAANREPTKPWEHPGSGEAFIWDLFSAPTLPAAYAKCDCLMVIPPWPLGFKFFEKAAAVQTTRSYQGFARQMQTVIEAAGKPTAIMLPFNYRTVFAKEFVAGLKLLKLKWVDGGTVTFGFWKAEPPANDGTYVGMVKAMAKSFDCVGDFLCGYGMNGRLFAESGKRYVMSDYNQKCIAYLTGKQ
jgi:hypothetical protein